MSAAVNVSIIICCLNWTREFDTNQPQNDVYCMNESNHFNFRWSLSK